MNSLEAYRYQLMTYGPFNIPQKKEWLIVGSGPSSDDYRDDLYGSDTGIIALNSAFRQLSHVDISIQSHYEDVYIAWYDFHKCDLLFIANPLHVGYRCLPVSTVNLFNYEDIAYFMPYKVRFFEKELNLEEAKRRTHTLFCRCSVISAAVYLLWRNGVTDAKFCGIDGGIGRGNRYKDMDVYRTDGRSHPNYDAAPKEMFWLAEQLKFELKPLERTHALV